MIRRSIVAACATVGLISAATARAQAPPEAARVGISGAERTQIREQAARLAEAIKALDASRPARDDRERDARADAAVCLKAAVWIDRLDEFYTEKHAAMTLEVIRSGLDRVAELAEGRKGWTDRRGAGIARGYVSKVDGSIQPYAVYLPAGALPEGGRYRLDVVLHGRDARITEVGFIRAHDGKAGPGDEPGIVLHVFGRGNNAYRWAGEADVFEAIDAVKRNFPVDDLRVALRGFSMGGAGAWHLGLHHPATWCAVEAGAGFADTLGHAKLKDVPPVQARGMTVYDAVDYALNAFNVPVAAYGGEDDPQLRASKLMEAELARLGFDLEAEGLVTRGKGIDFLGVVGAKTGHKVDAPSAALLKAFRDEHAARGLDLTPRRMRFTTHTARYGRGVLASVERMEEQFQRASIDVEIRGDAAIVATENVAALGVDRQAAETVRLGGGEFPLRLGAGGLLPMVYFRKYDDGWRMLGHDESLDLIRNAESAKAPGVQGPIDDAFGGPFLCVRGTGTPRDAATVAATDARLARFAELWARSMRGDLPIKDDSDVTDDDIGSRHLILFGDPGSNRLIARLLPALPILWDRETVDLGGPRPAAGLVPVLIAPNPRNPGRYVVLNSGHTFGARSFAGTNALLYPRLGDYALVRPGDGDPENDEVLASGFFDERWRPRAPAKGAVP